MSGMPITDWISALGVCVTAVAVAIAAWQLFFLHKETRSRNTREMIRRFVSDPMLLESIDHIFQKARTSEGVDYSNLGTERDESEKHVRRYLNALEELSHGVVKRELDTNDIKKEFGDTVVTSVNVLILGKDFDGRKARNITSARVEELKKRYPQLMELFDEWSPATGS